MSDNPLFNALAQKLVKRILDAEAKCDPPHDVDLRLASIIAERDALAARLAEAEAAIENAGCCLVMSNNGAREALNILRGYKRTADSASTGESASHE